MRLRSRSGVETRSGRQLTPRLALSAGLPLIRRSLRALSILGNLAGCAMQPQASAEQAGALSASDRHADYQMYSKFDMPSDRERLNQTAVQYVANTTGHDPDKLPHAVEACYLAAVGALDRQDSIQNCMILDYTGYKEILAGRRHPTFPERQYFSRESTAERWSHFRLMAGFTDPNVMFDYLRTAYAYVQPRADYIRRDSTLPPLVLRQPP